MTQSVSEPSRVPGASPPSSGEPGRQGLMKQNMEIDFVNRSPVGRQFTVTVKNFGPVRAARILGTASTFTRARRHLADGRDLISVVISGGGRFTVEGVQGRTVTPATARPCWKA